MSLENYFNNVNILQINNSSDTFLGAPFLRVKQKWAVGPIDKMTTDISVVRGGWDPTLQQEIVDEYEYDGGNSSSRLFERSRIKALAGTIWNFFYRLTNWFKCVYIYNRFSFTIVIFFFPRKIKEILINSMTDAIQCSNFIMLLWMTSKDETVNLHWTIMQHYQPQPHPFDNRMKNMITPRFQVVVSWTWIENSRDM